VQSSGATAESGSSDCRPTGPTVAAATPSSGGPGLLPLTVLEVRRLLLALAWAIRPAPGAHTTTDAKASAAGVLLEYQ
jgi:hypothetical protein